MIFEFIKRDEDYKIVRPYQCYYWYKGYQDEITKIENLFFKAETIGDSTEEAIDNLMSEISHNAGIEIYVKLIAKPYTWYISGSEILEYEGMRRFTLNEYLEAKKCGQLLCRGMRVKQHESESPKTKMGSKYFDGENCSIEEFDFYYTTDPIPELELS